MKTNKVVKKGNKTDFNKEKPVSAKVVKEKRPGKPIMNSIEDDEDDVKPLRPTTNSFFDEDYDAEEDDDDDDDNEDDDEEYDDDDEEELEEFQKIK